MYNDYLEQEAGNNGDTEYLKTRNWERILEKHTIKASRLGSLYLCEDENKPLFPDTLLFYTFGFVL